MYTLIRKLQSKCQVNSIKFITIQQNYTSKCSFLDKQPLYKQKQYKGSRLKRGLFKSSDGKLLNADINGAANILRKVIGDVIYTQPIMGLMFNPVKLNII